jgi:hypothetical protein
MKKFSIVLVTSACMFYACNNSQPTTATTSPDSTSKVTAKKEVLNYPYKAKYSLNWQAGDEKNAVIALQSMKTFNDGDVAGSVKDFADSAEIIFDRIHFKASRDSIKNFFAKYRKMYKEINVVPDTWITTYYPDQKDTWVTIWYTQTWTDIKGKVDSAYYTDDLLINDGKIKVLDEKQRLFPVPAPVKK